MLIPLKTGINPYIMFLSDQFTVWIETVYGFFDG
jgi:hypothetical protein